jgi:Beta-propeller repeat
MNTHSLTRRARPGVWMAGLALAALAVPTYVSLTHSDRKPDEALAASAAVVSGSTVANVVEPGSRGELVFSSYLGGREWDEATGAATDADGNTYVTGFTLSQNFPHVGAGTRGHDAIVDAFVTKVSADGSRIEWSTQIGGVDMDLANAVTVDQAGNVYVVGRTGSPDFPTARGLQNRLKGRACTGEPCHDAFVVKLSRTGQIQWSTLFGGTLNEEAVSVAVDESSAVYVAGVTDSPDLPVRGAFQPRFQSPPCEGDVPCPSDAFVTKLAPTGDRVVYSTYLGGHAADLARGIDVDSDGNAYVAGSTGSTDFPKVRAFQNTMRGEACGPPPGEPCRQAFLTKLRPSGATAEYSTYLGGREHDDAFGVAVDRQNRAHVTGSTQSRDFPTQNAFQPTLNNRACTSEQPKDLCDDGFVTKFAATGQSLEYSTYLGGRAEDQGLAIDVTRKGRALVAGRTDSRDFFTTANAAQPHFGGYIDGFALQLRPLGHPAWSSFLGGTDADRATGIAADRQGSAHLAGRTISTDFPTRRPFQPNIKDQDYDAFVAMIR